MINVISKPNKRLYRRWSPEFIISQFDILAFFGVKNIKIADELFVLYPLHFNRICDLIIERKYDFNIWCYSRVDTCKPEYLDKMKAAGINWIGLGIENPTESIRERIDKNSFRQTNVVEIINRIRGAGINVGGNYIFGLPGDTKESMQATLDFMLDNPTEMVNLYCAMAYPGSRLYDEAKAAEKRLPKSPEGYSQYSYQCLPLANDNLTSKEILQFRDKAFQIYHNNKNYLTMIEEKFGSLARQNIENTTKIPLERFLLGD